jgi:hypothetical protein
MDEIQLIEMFWTKGGGHSGLAPQVLSLELDEIRVGSARVGYVLRKPGAPINLIVQLDQSTEMKVRQAVAERDGTDPKKLTVSTAPVMEDRPNDT